MLPGSKVPADGVVVWGTSHVNESMITGESAPIPKEVSSVVIGGTINLHGILHIQATKVGSGTVLSQIISLVETAQMSKAPIQKFADYVSTSFLSIRYVVFPSCNESACDTICMPIFCIYLAFRGPLIAFFFLEPLVFRGR